MFSHERMSRHHSFLMVAAVTAMLLASVGAGAQQPEPTLTLPEAMRQALESNPQQVSQRLEVAKSENELRAARGAKMPSARSDRLDHALRLSHLRAFHPGTGRVPAAR